MHYHIVQLKTSVNRKIPTDIAHTMKAEKQNTHSKALQNLVYLKTFKFSRKNTGIVDNMIVQAEKFFKLPPLPAFTWERVVYNETITPANLILF